MWTIVVTREEVREPGQRLSNLSPLELANHNSETVYIPEEDKYDKF